MEILFVCRGNVGRSQMAEALRNSFNTKHVSVSAGVELSGEECSLEDLLPRTKEVITVMLEEGIDVSKCRRKQITEEMVYGADKIILIMEDETELPSYLLHSPKMERWAIAGPKGKDVEFTRRVRDEIKEKLEKLINEIE
jgi:protein-tyrosine-phosphatase